LESGLSQAEFCRQMNLSPHSFSYWKRKLDPPPEYDHRFVSQVVPVPLESPPSPQNPTPLRLHLGNGFRIDIDPGFCPDTLRELLAVVGEACFR
jgi:hypothetical protein